MLTFKQFFKYQFDPQSFTAQTTIRSIDKLVYNNLKLVNIFNSLFAMCIQGLQGQN